MKKLSISLKIETSDLLENITFFEETFNKYTPLYLIDFITEYGGSSIKEYNFGNANAISYFLTVKSKNNASIELILPAVMDKDEGIGRDDLIPFAIDGGGNPFYVSIGNNDFGSVYIDTITSRGFEEPIVKLADSFEEFIDGLKTDDEMGF